MSNNDSHKNITIDISVLMIVKILAVLLILIFLYLVKDIIFILFIALIIASAITPWVDSLDKRKIPRLLSTIVIYLIIFGLITLIAILVVPIIVSQFSQLTKNLPYYYSEILKGLEYIKGAPVESSSGLGEILQTWTNGLAAGTQTIFSTLGTIFGGVAGFIIVLVITFYITLEKNSVKKFLQAFTPIKYQPYVIQLSHRIQEKMGAWLKGQLLLSLIVGLLCYIGLTALGIKYALVLALIAGVTEIIPYVGPWLGGIPAVILAFIQSPIKALFVIILYLVVQEMENHFIVPQVMKRAVGLNPIMTIIAIVIGGELAGIAGAIIAVPLLAAISVIAKDIVELKKEKETL